VKVSRRGFAGRLGAAVVSQSAISFAGQAASGMVDDFYLELVKANDLGIPGTIQQFEAPPSPRMYIRRAGEAIEVLSAGFCAPQSTYSKSDKVIAPLERASRILLTAQHPDGTIDSGNLNSPPDTGFVVETVGRALAVLRREGDPRLRQVEENLGRFLTSAGGALTTGGIHTPNHRWVVCSALARIHSLFPSAKYVDRIDDWLGEGIYIDKDGQFSERSTGIYSRVIDNALVTMARLLNRPELLDPVRRNLDMTVYYMHPDSEVETIGSRRQDQGMVGSISTYYLEYRYLANRDRNPLYAAVARFIERLLGERVKRSGALINFLDEPILREKLPDGGSMPTTFAKVFSNSGLARIRRGQISATVYGGSDWPLGVASGLASNPTFFTFRNGKAILDSVRMGGAFFSEGAFRSEGLVASQNRYALHQRFEVPYYQPLPKSARNPQGDYKLTPAADERFWSKLNFPARAVSNVQTLDQRVTVVENRGMFELQFDISGHDGVPFTVELAFRTGGRFEGSVRDRGNGIYVLPEGDGRYRVGDDVIEFGPGQSEHEWFDLSGSSYTAHGARLAAKGDRVYITGFTPFRKTVTVRGVKA
jgi:hypothetical protein